VEKICPDSCRLCGGVNLARFRPLFGGDDRRMPPRSIWSGTISFGLVSVPVRMFSATQSRELKFHFVHKDDLEPVGYDKVRKDTGEHVDADDIVRAFEVTKGQYVPVTEEDIDRLDIELTHSIDICEFVDVDEIDPIFFRSAYYLVPQEGAEKPYALLVKALEETGKVGIAKVVIRNKQHLAALRPYKGALVLETMYYADEVREPELPKLPRVSEAEVEMAKTLVENLSGSFKPDRYHDRFREELLDLIKAKAKGEELPEPEQAEAGEVIDLMEALRASVERTQKSKAKRSPTRKKAASRKAS
jgi:DNA end-binding protein Ku